MTHPSTQAFRTRNSGHWIRLHTLILLRWWAALGQLAALVVAYRVYRLDLEYALCLLVIGASVLSNLAAMLLFPRNKRLSEHENLLVVLFDMLQLGLLLYLTGGLNNPFAFLIVGPVIVFASSLSTRSTMLLGLMAILIVTGLMLYNLPLRTGDGMVLRMPDIFRFGNWVAIVIAVIFLGVYSRWIVSEMEAMSDALQAAQMALAREQKLTDLAGVVAAAAHELGTPLATIKLTSSELAEDLPEGSDARDDALLIRQQADRCRDILRSMGRAGKDDLQLRTAPLSAVLEEAAEPHVTRGKAVIFDHDEQSGGLREQPVILRRPEIIHGLRNLIQNAVDFARATVWVETRWTGQEIVVRIMDDGAGYPSGLLGRIGDPFMRRRTPAFDTRRPEYEGMGLGLFIAKTLLERSGATLEFANGADVFADQPARAARSGAVVTVTWPRRAIDAGMAPGRPPTAQNQPITP